MSGTSPGPVPRSLAEPERAGRGVLRRGHAGSASASPACRPRGHPSRHWQLGPTGCRFVMHQTGGTEIIRLLFLP